jgi:mono/diheme cytochrome c family protein
MRKLPIISMGAVAALVIFVAAFAEQKPAVPPDAGIERGRYLVEEVARCGECHSPRDEQGELDHSRWLQGGPTWFTPTHRTINWAYTAPALAGLPSFSDADMTKVLEQGVATDGRPLRPPMHPYHLTHADATAIIAYLRSLKPGAQ